MKTTKINEDEVNLIISKLHGTNIEHPEIALKRKLENWKAKVNKTIKPNLFDKPKVPRKPKYLRWSKGCITLSKERTRNVYHIIYTQYSGDMVKRIASDEFDRSYIINLIPYQSTAVKKAIAKWVERYDKFIAHINKVD